MTVFDVLRFPRIDIFVKGDLDQLPHRLVEEWATAIISEVNYPFDINVKDTRNNFAGIAYNVALTKSKNERYVTLETKSMLLGIYKKQLTDKLMSMLAEFENPV